jgi:hypothetical protein
VAFTKALGFSNCKLPYDDLSSDPPCPVISGIWPGSTPVLTLDVPAAGNYLLMAGLDFTNLADGFPGFNDRFVQCRFSPGGPTYTIEGFELRRSDNWGHLSIHDVATYGGPTTIGVYCSWAEGWADQNNVKVYLTQGHLTAIQLSTVTRE